MILEQKFNLHVWASLGQLRSGFIVIVINQNMVVLGDLIAFITLINSDLFIKIPLLKQNKSYHIACYLLVSFNELPNLKLNCIQYNCLYVFDSLSPKLSHFQ